MPDGAALVLVTGPVASGKSTVARALAARLGAQRLEADRIRDTLLGSADGGAESVEARWRQDLSPDFETVIYDDLLERADAELAGGRTVVVDACFPRRDQRDAARSLALRHGVRFLFVACVVPEATLRARLDARDRARGESGWATIAARLAAEVEPADELEPRERVEVESDGPVDACIDAIVARLRAVPAPELLAADVDLLAPRPRVVSFDCWGTLLVERDWPWAHALRVLALHDAAREAGLDVGRDEAEDAFRTAWQRHMTVWEERQVSGAAEVARWGLDALGVSDAASLEHLIRRFEEASHTSAVAPLDDAPALLRALSRGGTPCVLVCDTGLTPGRVVRRLLDHAGLRPYLTRLAFSDEVGAPKPDARPFRAALQGLGVEPEDVVHVGDLRRTDVAGARALGMRTVRIRAAYDDESQWPEADYTVDSHAELASLLGVRLAPVSNARDASERRPQREPEAERAGNAGPRR